MSSGLSLQAARADNFYYPPEWDPSKGSLDKFHGQHPLRERAKKLDQGILVIRFEMPFNVWCKQCESLIGKGVRFNAEKKQIGNYLSTKIWSFTMRHHCGCLIEVQTDPKNAAYVVTQGARQKEESWNAEEAGVIDLGGDDHRDHMAKDPLYAVEHKEEGKRRAEQNKNRLRELQRHSDERHRDDAALNRLMRGRARANRRSDKALDARRHAIGLPSSVKLLPTNEADGRVASMVVFGGPSDQRFATSLKRNRQDILSQRIFAPGRKNSGAAGKAALKEKRKRMHPSVRLTAREPAASKASGGSS